VAVSKIFPKIIIFIFHYCPIINRKPSLLQCKDKGTKHTLKLINFCCHLPNYHKSLPHVKKNKKKNNCTNVYLGRDNDCACIVYLGVLKMQVRY